MGRIVWQHSKWRGRVSKCGRWHLWTTVFTRQWCLTDNWTGAYHWCRTLDAAMKLAESWNDFFEANPAMQHIAELLRERKVGVW